MTTTQIPEVLTGCLGKTCRWKQRTDLRTQMDDSLVSRQFQVVPVGPSLSGTDDPSAKFQKNHETDMRVFFLNKDFSSLPVLFLVFVSIALRLSCFSGAVVLL